MVLMPPGHGKSVYCSVRFPSWYLGKHPKHMSKVDSSAAAANPATPFTKLRRFQWQAALVRLLMTDPPDTGACVRAATAQIEYAESSSPSACSIGWVTPWSLQ